MQYRGYSSRTNPLAAWLYDHNISVETVKNLDPSVVIELIEMGLESKEIQSQRDNRYPNKMERVINMLERRYLDIKEEKIIHNKKDVTGGSYKIAFTFPTSHGNIEGTLPPNGKIDYLKFIEFLKSIEI